MAYTYQSFATLGVNLNRQNYGALDISQVFNSQGDLNYYLSKGTDTSAVSDYWKDTVPYPYEGQIIATVFDGVVKVYVLALNAEGNFVTQNVGDTAAVEASIAELEEYIGTLPEGTDATSVIDYINKKTEGIATDTALEQVQKDIDTLEETVGNADAGLVKKVADLETNVGKAAEGETAATGLHKALADEIARAQAAEQANANAISLLAENLTTEEIDSVKELVDYVNEHGTEVTGMKEDIAANTEAISGKADKATTLAGYGITDTYTKAETDQAIADKVADVTGGESAAAVKLALEAEVTRSTGKDTEHDSAIQAINEKLSGIETGAQVNVIEKIQLNGTDVAIADKTANISGVLVTADKTALTELINAAQNDATQALTNAATAQSKANEAASAASTNAADIVNLKTTTEGHTTKISSMETTLGQLGATVEGHTTSINDHATQLGNLTNKVGANETAIAALQEKDVELAGLINGHETRIKANEDAIAGLQNYDDTQVKADIAANTKAIEEEVARAKAAEEANATEIARVNGVLENALENDAEGLDSIKELAAWINTHGTEAADMASAIEANTAAIAAINNESTGILTQANSYTDAEVAKVYTQEFIFNGGSASTNLWAQA